MTNQIINLKNLVKSPTNVRRTASKAACEELKASILAHGLMQNLVVVPSEGGCFEVIAGGRRLEAMLALQAEGKLPVNFAVPCQVVTAKHARELSLAENTVRAAMHPADEFEAFAALADAGRSTSQIAERFGCTEKRVLQRLKLGRVAPELLAEYRAGAITLEMLEAFTITDDRKRQHDLYRGLQGWQRDSAHHIRRALTERMTGADDKLARFVGLDAYEAAGGRLKADLFGEDVYLEDTALLRRLAGEKLEAAAEELRRDGWGWVEVNFDHDWQTIHRCGRIEPLPVDAPAELLAELAAAEAEQTRIAEALDDTESDALIEASKQVERQLEAIEAKLQTLVDYPPVEKQLAGCYVSVGYQGELRVEKGLIKPEDKKAVPTRPGGEAEEAGDKPGLSQSLVEDLKRYRTRVAQVAFAENPTIAFDLLVFQAATGSLGRGYCFDGPDISFRDQHLTPSVAGDPRAAERFAAIRDDLPLAWLEEKTEPARFGAFQTLAMEDKHRILAYCTALTLRPKLAPAEGSQKSAYSTALTQTGLEVAVYWRPTAANFLGRVKREQLLAVGEAVLNPKWAELRKDAKKSSLVKELDEVFARSGDAPAEIKSWLPEGMEIPRTESVKAKKTRKAA